MSSIKVAISILSFNHADITIDCLDSLRKSRYPSLSILLNTCASKPKEIEKLKKYLIKVEDTRIVLLEEPQNLGFSGNNNISIERALEWGADYVILLNDDTIVPPNLIESLVNYGESHPRVGLIGPAIDEEKHTAYGGRVAWLQSELKHIYSLKDISDVDFLPGACLCIKRKVFEKIGLLDIRFFLYFEDAEFCLRARKAGFDLACVSSISLRHEVSSTTRKLGSPALLYYHFRNAHLFNWLCGPISIKIFLPLWSFYCIIKQLLKLLIRPSHRNESIAILKGILDFYRARFGKSPLQKND